MLKAIALVARHEVIEAWRSWVIVTLGVAFTGLTVTAGIVAQAKYHADSAQRQRYQALVGTQFADQPDRHPHRVSHYGYLVFRPRAPLGFFDSGIESFVGTSLFLEAHRQNAANFSMAVQSGGSDRWHDLTPATVLQLFVPLFIFAVAGVSITREREGGTLPLLLCQGGSWASVVWGKLVGTLVLACAVLVPGVVLAWGWVAWRTDLAWTADVVSRAVALVLVHGVFLVVCSAVAVTVSAWHTTSRAALVTLVGFWFTLWIVVPRVLPALATALYAVPARAAFEAEVEARVMELGDSHNPDDPMFARLRAETLQRYGVARVEDLPFNYSGFVNQESEALTSDAYRVHVDRLNAVFRRQSALVAFAGVLSPYLAIRAASMALAGSDVAHHLEFERQAEAFRFDLVQALNGLHMREVVARQDRYGAVVNGAPTRQRISSDLFETLPTFDVRPPTLAWAIGQQAWGFLAGAMGAACALGALAWASTRRARLG